MPDIDFAAAWAERWGGWGRWPYRTARPQPTFDRDGRFVRMRYEPDCPPAPEGLSGIAGCDDYDTVAPWRGLIERAWITGCELPDKQCPSFSPTRDAPVERQHNAWDNGRTVGRSKAGAAYRAYLAECRGILKKASWHEDEIP